MIHCFLNNIDALELTLGGNNTFYCIWMIGWQRGPPAPTAYSELGDQGSWQMFRARAVESDSLQAFQAINPACLTSGERPKQPPLLYQQFRRYGMWFHSSEEMQYARLTDLTWVISWIHDQFHSSVLSWQTFKEVPRACKCIRHVAHSLSTSWWLWYKGSSDGSFYDCLTTSGVEIHHHYSQSASVQNWWEQKPNERIKLSVKCASSRTNNCH